MKTAWRVFLVATLLVGMVGTVSAQSQQGFYPLNSTNGGSSFADFEGSKDLSISGSSSIVSGKFGDAAEFGDYEYGHNSNPFSFVGKNSAFSVAFSLNPDTTDRADGQAQAPLTNIKAGDNRWIVKINNDQISHQVYDGASWSGDIISYSDSSSYTTFVATHDGNGDYNLYKSGNTNNNFNTLGGAQNNLGFRIGTDTKEVDPYSGKVDNVRVFDYELTQSQAESLATCDQLSSCNNPPTIDSVSTSPSSWTLNSDVNVSANVSDSDGTVSNVSADVWENGTQIVSGQSLTNNSGTWEIDNLFTVDESDVYYNLTLTATDNDGATTTYEDNRLIKNLDPKINHLKPVNNSNQFTYSPDYEILIKDDGDNVPGENISCELYSNGDNFRNVSALESDSQAERTFTGQLNEDVGSNKFRTLCVDGGPTNTTTKYETKYSKIQNVNSVPQAYETENRTYELDLKTGDMVNSADFGLVYDGSTEKTKQQSSNGIETLRPDFNYEVPLVSANQTDKNWNIEYDLNISDFQNQTTSTFTNTTSNQTQTVLWSYYIENSDTNPANGKYIETEDLKHDVKLHTETKKASLDGTTTYNRNGDTDTMETLTSSASSETLRGVIDVGLADTFNQSSFTAESSIDVLFNGDSRTLATGTDTVEVYKIRLTDGSTNLNTAEALKFDVDYEEENYDTKTKLTMDLSLWKNRDEKIRRYQFQETPAQTHSYNIYPKWAEYKIRTLPYPGQKKFDLIQYFNQDTNKVRRSYFFPTVQTISNQTTTIPLKTINESETTAIDFEITNNDGDPAEDTYCRVDRKFGGGDFETVFMIKTGSEGKSQSFAEVNEIYYGFTCYQDGQIADEFSAQIMQNPMRLQLGGGTVATSLDYTSKFDASCTSNTTRLECDYQSQTDKLKQAVLTVERNEVKQDVTVCDKSSPTATGKLTCTGLNTTQNSYNYEMVGEYPNTDTLGATGFLGTQAKPFPAAGLFMTAILFMLTTAATAFDLRVGIASGTLVFLLTSTINWIVLNPSQQATLVGVAIIAGVAVSQ